MSNSVQTVLISGNSHDSGISMALAFVQHQTNIILLIDKNESCNQNELARLKSLNPNIVLAQGYDEKSLADTMQTIQAQFGGLDVLINNIGVAFPLDTSHIHAQQFDLMHNLNIRNAFLLSKTCFPMLKASSNPHIINISPPLDIDKSWFSSHLGFSMSAYSMSMCTLGMSQEFKKSGIAVNSLWPAKNWLVSNGDDDSRNANLAQAVFVLSQKNAKACSGRFFIDTDLQLPQEDQLVQSVGIFET